MSASLFRYHVAVKQKLKTFRNWRWFWLTISGAALVLVVPTYVLVASFAPLPSSLKPGVVLHNPIQAIAKAATQTGNVLIGHGPSPSASPNPIPNATISATKAADTGTGPSAIKNGRSPTAQPNPTNHELLFDSPIITLGVPGQYLTRSSTDAYTASKVNLTNVQAVGSRADIGILPFTDSNYCPYYQQASCSVWSISAVRNHPDGSGTSYFTVTAQDAASTTYTGHLTINWLAIPYFVVSNVSATLNAGDGNSYPVVFIDYDITGGPNFGTHQLQMTASVPWPYSCLGNGSYAKTVTGYTGTTTHYQLSCTLVGDQNLERSAGYPISVSINADIMSAFQTVGASAQIPKW